MNRGTGARVAWPATLAQKRQLPLHASHLRYVRRASSEGALHCFVLDCSASMLVHEQLARAKGMLLACFDRAAAERAEVALICFGGASADLRFGPAVPRWWNERWVAPIGGAGGTPFELGIATATQLLARTRRRKPYQQRVLWVMTDGRCLDEPAKPDLANRIIFVDCEHQTPKLGRCIELASEWGAACLSLEELMGPQQ